MNSLNDHAIDRSDRKILQLLQRDGRMSNLALAEAIHLSPTATQARVQRLHKQGWITGYRAEVDAAKLGLGLCVFVEVLLDRTTENVFEEFAAVVKTRDEILECHLVAGGFDYLLKTRLRDMQAYRRFASAVLWKLPGVRETRTYAVMEEVKSSTILAI